MTTFTVCIVAVDGWDGGRIEARAKLTDELVSCFKVDLGKSRVGSVVVEDYLVARDICRETGRVSAGFFKHSGLNNAAEPPQHRIRLAPSIEAGVDRLEYLLERGEVAVVSGQAPGKLPEALDRGELWTVGRQKQQPQARGVFAQKRLQKHGVMIAGVVEHAEHAAPAGSMSHQLAQKAFECLGVKHLAHATHELAAAQVDCAKAGDRFARRRMQQDRVLVQWRYPHSASRAMLLEVAFVQAPQFEVISSG